VVQGQRFAAKEVIVEPLPRASSRNVEEDIGKIIVNDEGQEASEVQSAGISPVPSLRTVERLL
jgi:hypothetical protein